MNLPCTQGQVRITAWQCSWFEQGALIWAGWRVCLLFKITNFMAILLSLIFWNVQFSNWLRHVSNVLNQTKVSKELFHVCLFLLSLLSACNTFNIQYRCNVQYKLKTLKSLFPAQEINGQHEQQQYQFTVTAGTPWLCPFVSHVWGTIHLLKVGRRLRIDWIPKEMRWRPLSQRKT